MTEFDPMAIKNKSLPVVVFSEHSSGFFSFLIRWRTKGMYNHSMTAIGKNILATQGLSTFKKVPFSAYMKKSYRLKFVGVSLSISGKKAVINSIKKKLSKSKLKKSYDWPGIIGQAIGLKWINNPWTHICSEDVVYHLKKAIPFEPKEMCEALNSLPDHGSPADVNRAMKEYSDCFFVLGRWQWD